MSHVAHVNQSWHKWVTAHIWTSHGTHMIEVCHRLLRDRLLTKGSIKESWHTYKWVTLRICMSHVTHKNESCCAQEWVMLHTWMSHVARVNESCHTYKWIVSHTSMSHVTHVNRSCHTYEWVMSHIWVVPHIWTCHGTWLGHVTDWYVTGSLTNYVLSEVMSLVWISLVTGLGHVMSQIGMRGATSQTTSCLSSCHMYE